MPIGIARSQITTPGTGGGGGAGGNWLDVKSFGAVGSGSIIGASSITSGTPNLSVTEDVFVVEDVGETIMVAGAGPDGTDLWTTIAAFVDAQNVTLADNASTTVPTNSNWPGIAVWGAVDDTTAIQACVDAASLAGLGVYFSPGVYLLSNSIALPVNGPPPFMFGNSSINASIQGFFNGSAAFLVSNNPLVAPYSPFINWDTQGLTCSLRDFSIIGGSFATSVGPTAGAMLQLYTEASAIERVGIYNSPFQWGFDIQNSFGNILGTYSSAQDRFMLDTTVVNACQAAAFINGGPIGGEGGVMESCIAVGGWPNVSACFSFDVQSGNLPVEWSNCRASNADPDFPVPLAYAVTDGVVASRCTAESFQIGFLIGTGGKVDHCVPPVNYDVNLLADFVVSNGEIPFRALTGYFLNQIIIDTNGNYQQVTVAGTSGATAPTWATVNGNPTVTGTVTFTKIANPGYTQVSAAVIQHCSDVNAAAPISLYDLGYRTTLDQNSFFIGSVITVNPAQVLVSGIQTVSMDYQTTVDDDMVRSNATSPITITLTTTNQVPGHSQTIKQLTSSTVTVVGENGELIDGYPSVAMTIPMMALNFKWDGVGFSIW
jgi:hypothetical protein